MLEKKYGAGGYRQPYFFMPNFENFATEERKITHWNKGILYVWGIERSGFFNGREKWAKGFENQRV